MRGRVVPVVVLMLLPLAQAQMYEFQIDGVEAPPEPIPPNLGTGQAHVHWTISCLVGAWRYEAFGELHWQVEAPEGVRITGGSKESVRFPECPVEPSVDGTSSFNVQVARQGPEAFVPVPILLNASMIDPMVEGPAGSDEVAATVVADYVGLISVNTPTTVLRAEPGATSRVEIHLLNLGNGPTEVRMELISGDASNVVLPEPFVLPWNRSGEVDDVITEIQFHHQDKLGRDNVQELIQVRMIPHSEADPTAVGHPVTVTLLFRTMSMPGSGAPALPLFAVVLVLAGLVARRR